MDAKEGVDMDTAVFGLLGVVAGTVLGAVLQEWRARNDEDRALRRHRLQRAADLNLRRLTATRRRLGGEADWAIAYGIASSTDVDRALQAAKGRTSTEPTPCWWATMPQCSAGSPPEKPSWTGA
jgi:hypothetical protein